MSLLERMEEDWILLDMFRRTTRTDSLNRPMNDLREAKDEIERLRAALKEIIEHFETGDDYIARVAYAALREVSA